MRKEWPDGTPVESDNIDFPSASVTSRIHEVNFEINDQLDHIRQSQMSYPFLALPTVVSHVIDENSPFFPLNLDKFFKYDFELIALLDGTDEAVSNNVQARWSYLPQEFVFDHNFVNITEKNKLTGKYTIDFSKFNSLVSLDTKNRFSTNTNENNPQSTSTLSLTEDLIENS